ncbi:MAG: hypothetical protein MN733_30145, partial [Nitrososphaera sp.]|nr:hypothetical protein [Nitrososphaera sp.]
SWIETHQGVNDSDLARLYNRCDYVSGLRFTEGFELPVLEGIACGARPICFDLPCYRNWFENFAEFVPHVKGRDLVQQLTAILSRTPQRLSPHERRSLLAFFSWERIARVFWQSLLSRLTT